MASVIGDKSMNKLVSHLPEVRAAVRAAAQVIATTAAADLENHRQSGDSEIVVEHGTTDSFVSLVDDAAVSIEFGHFVDLSTAKEVIWVDGLYVISRAAGLI